MEPCMYILKVYSIHCKNLFHALGIQLQVLIFQEQFHFLLIH